MRYRLFKRRAVHFSAYHKPMPRGQRLVLFIIINILVFFTAFSIILAQLKPIMVKLAIAEVSEVTLYSINSLIEDEITKGTFDYSKLVTLEKDNDGNITALVTNMALVNVLQARISKSVLSTIRSEMVSDLKIPIGNAVGGVIFSGRGPSFVVKVLSVAYVSAKFTNDFSSAGINQTRHKIMLEISVNLNIFVPGTKSVSHTVTDEVEVCETVIVGKVPYVYADMGGGS